MRPARLLTLVLAATVALVWPIAVVAAEDREFGDVEVFAEVGSPGQPEGIAVDDDGFVYVSTNNRGKGDADEPSVIFRYTPEGDLDREYVIEGQPLDELHGVLGLAFDGDGLLYALDYNPARVLRIDPETGEQETYATIPDLPRCGEEESNEPCEPSSEDSEPWPNWPVFDPDGHLYVTDLHQATIWRIPPGGEAEVWHQSADYDSIFSLNGQQFDADGDLVFVLTGSLQPGSPTRGHIYRLEVHDDGSAGEAELLHATGPAEGPDGLALGVSGRIYVALVTTHHILVLESDGTEVARVPGPVENQQQDIPFDSPASIAFEGTSILVTNHAYFTENEDSWAVLDMEVAEAGLPLHHPRILPAQQATGSDSDPEPEREEPAAGDSSRDAPAETEASRAELPATGADRVAGTGLTILLVAALMSAANRGRGFARAPRRSLASRPGDPPT